MIVDAHVHPLADDRARYPRRGGSPDSYDDVHATAEDLVALMDQAGVDKLALVSSFNAYGYDNRYCVDAISAHPERFVGACCIDGSAADAPQSLTHWFAFG